MTTARVPGSRKRKRLPILVGLPVIQHDLDEDMNNAIALRNTTWIEGVCANCGATPKLTPHPELHIAAVSFMHDESCPVNGLLDPQVEDD